MEGRDREEREGKLPPLEASCLCWTFFCSHLSGFKRSEYSQGQVQKNYVRISFTHT